MRYFVKGGELVALFHSSHFLVAHFVRHRDPARLSFLSAETSDFLFKDNQLGSKVECAAIYNSQDMEAT